MCQFNHHADYVLARGAKTVTARMVETLPMYKRQSKDLNETVRGEMCSVTYIELAKKCRMIGEGQHAWTDRYQDDASTHVNAA
jgi:hypothetical protein